MEKIQIREINDIRGNRYKIYDYMRLTEWRTWKSIATYFDLESALRGNKNILIEDLTEL